MIRTKTVFVLGAGTSVDFGFPLGTGLLNQIRESLNFRFDHSPHPTRGEGRIFEAIRRHFREVNRFDRTNQILEAGHKIVSASEHALSIDNVIDTLEDEDISFIGKIAIACEIMKAESGLKKKLTDTDDPRRFDLHSISGSWVAGLLQLLTADVRASQISSMFDNVCIVNFNYDRILEYIFPALLSRHYNISDRDAQAAFANLKVYRPYGRLGRLGWQDGADEVVEFGILSTDRIVSAGSALRTFTEQVTDEKLLEDLGRELDAATRVIFLGFGFHRQNIQLISRRNRVGGEIVGTTFGVPVPEVEIIERDIRTALVSEKSPSSRIRLVDADCKTILKSYARLITS